tara:strand:- start:249169 stop:250503 length:1335 start_codon:yes stop_codon:yes gene_type:complete
MKEGSANRGGKQGRVISVSSRRSIAVKAGGAASRLLCSSPVTRVFGLALPVCLERFKRLLRGRARKCWFCGNAAGFITLGQVDGRQEPTDFCEREVGCRPHPQSNIQFSTEDSTMKRSTKKVIAVMTTVAALASQAAPVLACGGGGGGYGGRIFSRPSTSYSRPVSYASPTYASSSYRYSQPNYGYPSSTTMQSQFGSVPQRVLSAAPQQVVQQRPTQVQSAPVQSTQAQPVQGQLNQGQIAQSQPVQNQTVQNPTGQNSTVQNQSVQTQSNVGQSTTTPQSVNTAPSANQVAQNQQATTNGNAPTQQANTTVSSEQSALQMLASIAAPAPTPSQNQASSSSIPQFAPAAAKQPEHVGTWTATLPNRASIRLQLGTDGKFSWTATQEGKTSTFAGDYRVAEGRLLLVRSGDRQELKGTWSGNLQSGFNFKLDGTKDSGLDFQKS